jgi:hypothetical protein
MPAKDSIFKK